MTIADVLAVIASLGLAGLGFPALVSLIHLLLPAASTKASASLARHPLRLFALGLFTLFAVLVAVSVSGNVLAGPGKLVGLFVLLCTVGVAGIGWSGLAVLVAKRLAAQSARAPGLPDVLAGALDRRDSPCAIPIIGWITVLPIALLVSLGAGVSALSARPGTRSSRCLRPRSGSISTREERP